MMCIPYIQLILLFLFTVSVSSAQTIGEHLPQRISKSQKYLFYLHGAVVTELGNNAINQSVPEWGPYEYLNILDSLRWRGFNVISEIRKKGVDNAVYSKKIISQVDSLRKAGVPIQNIVVVGASAGWDIALNVSSAVKDKRLNVVIMGGCWPETYKEYSGTPLYGRFLSIIEKTDPHGSCAKIFEGRKTLSDYKEIMLATGLSHGFIYKGYREWVDPLVAWMNRK